MILVTGGAGYIGSHMVKTLLDERYQVVVFDNLSTGHREAIPSNAYFVKGDLLDRRDINNVFNKFPIDAVIHFAANCYVGESMEKPEIYYRNNIISLLNLLDEMRESNLRKIIFSSSCAVYGIPEKSLIDEDTRAQPISPYGRTKFYCEEIIQDYSNAYGLEYIFLRYFNVAGSDPDGRLGEDHQPETHLIPNILRHLQGQKDKFVVYGNDYDTQDGTCIRDFIHVTDLVNGHLAALSYLMNGLLKNEKYNLGRGEGSSINQIVKKCEKITGRKATIVYKDRRPGDPPRLIANNQKAANELNWKADYSLDEMVKSAWEWFVKHPHGYSKGIK